MNLLFTICARAGSKGVKSKNTREFCGQPLAYYTLASYQLFIEQYGKLYDKIHLAVNTDSQVLLEQIDKTDICYYAIPRETLLAGDVVAKLSVIRDTLQKAEGQTAIAYDAIIDLDLTSPIRTEDDIKGTLDAVLQDKNADIAISVTLSRRSPYFNMVCQKENGYYNTVMQSEFVARQQAPICYDMNASIYAYKREYLFSERTNDRKAVIWEMKDTGILDIDSEEDYELLGLIAENYNHIDENSNRINRKAAMLRKV